MTDFKTVALDEIKADPNQPRHIYDETSMQELTQSIKEKGVLQPVLLRPSGKWYLLVCGERRFRASKEAGLKDIPAVIRELTDDEALELQIIENLQRKDVHPMEEGVAFKSLLERKGWTVQEIAHRVGKKDFYVKQRLRLNDLSKVWQTVFYRGALTLTDALKVCIMTPADQQDLYATKDITKEDLKKENLKVEFDNWTLNKYKGNLSDAAFDLMDPFLDKKMGACSTCKYNTACASLFPDSANDTRCMNISCFKNKTQKSFEQQLKIATEDPSMIFVNSDYNDHAKEIASLQKEHGMEVIGYGSFSTLDAPEKPEYEEWKDDNEQDFDNAKEMKFAWDTEMLDYEKELEEYNKKVSSGKYKKALVVAGDDKGKLIYVTMGKKSNSNLQTTKTSKDVQESIKAGEATLLEIQGEVDRIKENVKKGAELDQEKIQAAIMEKYILLPTLSRAESVLTAAETACLIWYILDRIHIPDGYNMDKHISALFGFKKDDSMKGKKRKAVWEQMMTLTDNHLALAFRRMMHDEFAKESPRGYSDDNAFVMRRMAEELMPSEIVEIEKAFQEKAETRLKNAQKKIAQLEEKMAGMKPKKKAAPKNPSKLTKGIKSLLEEKADDDPDDDSFGFIRNK